MFIKKKKKTQANLTHQTDTSYQIILPSAQPDHHMSQLKLLQRNSSGVEMLLDRPSKIPN